MQNRLHIFHHLFVYRNLLLITWLWPSQLLYYALQLFYLIFQNLYLLNSLRLDLVHRESCCGWNILKLMSHVCGDNALLCWLVSELQNIRWLICLYLLVRKFFLLQLLHWCVSFKLLCTLHTTAHQLGLVNEIILLKLIIDSINPN